MSHLSDEALLKAFRRYGRAARHLKNCPVCQKRQADLTQALSRLVPQPQQLPLVGAHAILERAAAESRNSTPWSLISALALPAVLVLIHVTSQHPVWPAPVAMTATSLPFASSHVSVQWRPGDVIGRIHTANLVPHSAGVLEVWMVSGSRHVPVTVLPLTAAHETIIFTVPYTARFAEAIGITMEPSPNMPAPTGPRIFGYHFSQRRA